ncbi:hypothetical protein E3N88_17409 [Mikania micrantha]|uniref:Protein kinase domain-containing protein n=1 Tax=Mikania micrantha TaxID=192012 RepID=A0A5N6NTM4_9ASTR|nr:hypothetical protein E3N88_17409 [Mikania micrantha]
MMAQSSYRVRSVGDYVVGKQIGSGSFSVVWHARHKVHGTEVAIKEIITGKLNKKWKRNLLLSTNDDNSILKIADFGFARSLQPRNLAETLCGSPLYMAPEIMQLHKYDAKADLWSVGAILFQLVTGRTPFTGNNHLQLLQNIMKSTELQFPSDVKDVSPECIDLCRKLLRQNPVERLTFEEFFSHPFFIQTEPDELPRDRRPQKTIDGFSYPIDPSCKNIEEINQEDNLTFIIDDDSNDSDGSPPFVKRSPLISTYGFSLGNEVDEKDSTKDMEVSSRYMDLLESIDQDYVLVSGPLEETSSFASVAKVSQITASRSPSRDIHSASTAPLPIIGGVTSKICSMGSFESQCSAPSGTSHGSIEAGHQLEAFSIQLVILAIWKQALDICHTQAASAIKDKIAKSPQDVCCHIERIFLGEVDNAEQLAKVIEPGMPFNTINIAKCWDAGCNGNYIQAALSFGKHGAVDECMGFTENAAGFYSKAVRLLSFLLVEAPSLILNPPFSITNSDRYRLRMYIDVLNNRQSHSRSQRITLLTSGGGSDGMS